MTPIAPSCPLTHCRTPDACAERDACDFADGHPARDTLRGMGEVTPANRGTDAMWLADAMLKAIRDIGSTPSLSQAAGHIERAREAIRAHFN